MKRSFRDVKYAKANYALGLVFCACFVQEPCEDHWGTGLDAMEDALKLERYVYQSLLDVHNISGLDNDPQV